MVLPASSFPLDLVNQNLVVTEGSMKAWKTVATGFRIIIWHSTVADCILSMFSIFCLVDQFVSVS